MPSFQPDLFQEQRALLVSNDLEMFSALVSRFKESGARLDVASDVLKALTQIERDYIEIVVVDCSVPDYLECIRLVRKHKRRIVCLAIASSGTNAKALFSAGAVLAIYKPLTAEKARSSVRAAQNLSGRQLRRTPRFSLLPIVQISRSVDEPLVGQIIDISETGIGIETGEAPVTFEVGSQVDFRLMLPSMRRTIHGSGKIVRIDRNRRLGVRFVNFFNEADRKLLVDWIKYMSDFWTWREQSGRRPETEQRRIFNIGTRRDFAQNSN